MLSRARRLIPPPPRVDSRWAEAAAKPAGYDRAVAAAERAIALAPESAEGYWARGRYRYATAFDWRGGEADLTKALALNQNFAPALVDHAVVLAMQGRLADRSWSCARR